MTAPAVLGRPHAAERLLGGRETVRAASLVACAIAAACGNDPPPELEYVVVEAPEGVEVATAALQPAPAVVERVELAPGRWSIGVPAASLRAGIALDAPGACRARLGAESETVTLEPWIDVGPPVAQVGYDAPFRIEVRPGCREATAGGIAWRHAGGAEPRDLATDRNGFVVTGRTPPLDVAHGAEVPWGVVPISPRTRGAIVLEAEWTGTGRASVRRTVQIAAAPRATGLPSVPVGGRVLLGGTGWEIAERPHGGAAELTHEGSLAALVPDVVGTFRLHDAAGTELLLRAGRYDDTPLDCGRAECHASAASGAAASAMTSVLARGLEGGLGESYAPSCAVGCHSVGEPGLPDGGFAHVLHAGGFELPGGPRDDAWGALPIALRRLGGVGCVACHGPGAIPAPESRWAVLRSDVCATCHDAPPRYGHVAAWRESKMSRSDADARTREDSACRTCHTTSGFLARIGVRTEEQPPEGIGPLGIACAACHAPHGENVGTALLRAVPVANRFADADARSRVCVACHAPLEPGDALPAASAAPIVLARGGSIDGTAEHRAVEGTCIGCHRAGPEGIERGAAHGFAADASACAACHEDDVLDRARVASAEIASRARELFAELSAAGVVRGTLGEGLGPLHAARPELVDPASPLAPAARDVVLVLEDPAAGAHGPLYARELLDAAAAAIR